MKSVKEVTLKSLAQPDGSMQPAGRKQALVAAISKSALMTAALMLAAGPVQAIEISHGEISGSFDTTISYGIGFRASDAKDAFLGKAAINPFVFSLDNAGQRQAPGRWSVNNDLGNRNYSEAGDVISNTVKFTSELDLTW